MLRIIGYRSAATIEVAAIRVSSSKYSATLQNVLRLT